MPGRRARLLTVAGALFLGLCLVLFGLDMAYYHYSAPLSHKKTVIIPKGTSLTGVAHRLGDAGVIRFPFLFKINAVLMQKHRQLKAGEYLFPAYISPKNVLKKMAGGDVVIRRLTIPEGFSVAQILERLRQEEALEGNITETPEEGSLLPETYFFSYGDARESLLQRMQARMQEISIPLWEKRENGLPFGSLKEALILASIVEKETGIAGERGLVASVFINRLRKNMPLQSDPTVIYAITKGEQALDRPLTKKDLRAPSPFNTYVNAGLPPAPIANPGIDSIKAVLDPPDTNHLYFVASGDGGHVFAATLDGHNRNVANYRKKLKEQKDRQ